MAHPSQPTPKGPYKLVTVNTVPERATRLIGQAVQALSDEYTIIHAANCTKLEIDEVEQTVKEIQPDLLCCASMWTPEESAEIRKLAKGVIPGLKTYAIPQGLQVQEGPEAVVSHLKVKLPELINS